MIARADSNRTVTKPDAWVASSDQRYRALISAVAQIVWRTDGQGNPVELIGWEEVTGQSLAEMRRDGFGAVVHPKDLPAVIASWQNSVAQGQPHHALCRLRTRGNGYRWYRVHAVPVLERDVVVEWIGLTTDVHDQKEAEEATLRANQRLHSVIALQSELAAVGTPPAHAMNAVAERVCSLVNADLGAVAVPAGDEFEYAVMVGRNAPEKPPRLHRRASLTGWCFENGQSVSSADIREDSRASTAAQQEIGVRSLMLVPVMVKGKSVAVLSALSREPATFSEENLSVLELLAGILGAALANAMAHDERQLLLAERTAALVRSTRSEELFRALAEHSDEVIYIADTDGTLRYVSPSVTKVSGLKAEEVQGTNAFAYVHPEDREALSVAFRQILGQAGRSETTTLRVRGPRNDWKYLEFCGRNLTHIPAINGIAANARDVTDRVNAARAIEFQAMLLRNVEQAVVAIDLDGKVTYWNRFAETLYGWTGAEAIGKPLNELRIAVEQPEAAGIMERLFAGEGWRGEYRLRRKDGTEFNGYVIDTPLVDASGKVTGICGVSSDITELCELQSQLRQAQKMEAVGQLAGGVAHDFNNMLTAITSYSELLLQTEDDSEKREDLLEIKGAARRAADLTKKLLAFSRKQVMHVQELELGEVLRGIERLLVRIIGENVVLDASYPEEAIFIEADPTQIEQVIMNLVVNSRDAMPNGGTVRLQLRTERDCAVVRVIDNGIGMPESVRVRIFEPFFSTKPSGKGTGLGLSVVYGIIQQFRGTIDVRSEPGAGTEFTIRLPLVVAGDSPAQGNPAASAETRSILVVDDNPIVAELARRILQKEGYRVDIATTAPAAVTRARENPKIDLLLTDMIMPEMSGTELVDEFRKRGSAPRILYSSGRSVDECTDCIGRSDRAFIGKPWTPRELVAAVRAILDENRKNVS